jgi:hypothetical protein
MIINILKNRMIVKIKNKNKSNFTFKWFWMVKHDKLCNQEWFSATFASMCA